MSGEQALCVLHEHAALAFIEDHVLQPDGIGLADAAQAERMRLADADPGAAGAAGEQAAAVLAEERGDEPGAALAEHPRADARIEIHAAARGLPHGQARSDLAGHAGALAQQQEHGRLDGREAAERPQVMGERADHAVGQLLGIGARAQLRDRAFPEEHGGQRGAGEAVASGGGLAQPGVVDLAVGIGQLALADVLIGAVAHEPVERRERRLLHHMAQHRHALDIQNQFTQVMNVHRISPSENPAGRRAGFCF